MTLEVGGIYVLQNSQTIDGDPMPEWDGFRVRITGIGDGGGCYVELIDERPRPDGGRTRHFMWRSDARFFRRHRLYDPSDPQSVACFLLGGADG